MLHLGFYVLRFQRSSPKLTKAKLMHLIGNQGEHALPVGLCRTAAVVVVATGLFQLVLQVAHVHSFGRQVFLTSP